MKLDNTTKSILIKLQTKYNKEFNKDISLEGMLTIVDSQFSSIPAAMKVGKVIKLDKLGKLKIKEGRANALKDKSN